MRKLIVLGMVLVLASTGYAASLQEGTQEVVVEGLLDPTTGAGSEFDVSLAYGQFVQDNIEVGAFAEYADNDAVSAFGLGVFGEYNFDMGTELVPFVGASIGYFNADFDEGDSLDGINIEGQAGVKYFLAENVAISGAVVLDWATEDIYQDDEDFEDTDVTIQVAMRFFLPAAGP